MKLKISDLSMEFDQKVVLKGINYTFENNKIYALLGRNGAGKTTFFNCIADELQATTKTIELVSDTGVKDYLDQDDVGYVVSTPVVPEFLTGREFLKFVLDIHKMDASDDVLDNYFDYLSIDQADRDILMKNYSHGMKNKMQMLINIITKPSILLLDEPLTAFDVVVAEEMKKLLKSIKKDYIIIFSTHIMELAMDLCDIILVLHEGYIQEVHLEELERDQMKEKIINLLKEETI